MEKGKVIVEDDGSFTSAIIEEANKSNVIFELNNNAVVENLYAPSDYTVSGENVPVAKQFITAETATEKGYVIVSNANELKTAIEEAGTDAKIAVGADLDVILTANEKNEIQTFATAPVNKNITLDLNNHVITAHVDATNYIGNHSVISLGGDSIIEDVGSISLKVTGKDLGWSALSEVVTARKNLTINGSVELIHEGETSMAYAIDTVSNHGNDKQHRDNTIVMNGGKLSSSNYTAVRLYKYSADGSCNFVLNNGTIEGKRCFYMASQSASATETASVTLNGGKLIAWQRVFQFDANSKAVSDTVNIKGGYIECTADGNATIVTNNNKLIDQLGTAGKENLVKYN